MRRRHRRHHAEVIPRTRDHSPIATPVRSAKIVRVAPSLPSLLSILDLEDRREFHPEGRQRPARARKRSDAQLVARPSPPGRAFIFPEVAPARIGFSKPAGVSLCVRRTVRRQVMHAKGKAGAYYPGKWSEYSYVDCTDDSGHRFKRR